MSVLLKERKNQICEQFQKDNMNRNRSLQRKSRKPYNASTLLRSPECYWPVGGGGHCENLLCWASCTAILSLWIKTGFILVKNLTLAASPTVWRFSRDNLPSPQKMTSNFMFIEHKIKCRLNPEAGTLLSFLTEPLS